MAEKCRGLILECDTPAPDLPESLQPGHLLWMCDRIEEHVEDWAVPRLHRWIGFVQCAMLAHGILDLEGAKTMFDNAKVAHGEPGDNLVDHLDPDSSFELDIGGEG